VFSVLNIARKYGKSSLNSYIIKLRETGGREVSARISPKIEALTGVFSDGFKTNGHPAAIAGPIL
jgi:hypothetical protein